MSSADRLVDNFATTVQMQGKPGQIKPRSIAKYMQYSSKPYYAHPRKHTFFHHTTYCINKATLGYIANRLLDP